MKQICCQDNIDTACVEIKYDNGMMVSIDCIAVENTVPRNMYERSALDWLVYNAPWEYVELILFGEIENYLREYTDYSRLDKRHADLSGRKADLAMIFRRKTVVALLRKQNK